MKIPILLMGLLVFAIVLSGCVGNQDVTSFVKTLPEVQAFLEKNPDAEIKAVFLNKQTVTSMILDIRKDCGQQMQEVPYWYVTITKGKQEAKIYLDETGKQALCIIKPGTEPPSGQDECSTAEQCNDNNPATKDECKGTPKKCGHTQVAACKKEGETIPVIAEPPECCSGLTLIPPKDPQVVGIMGYCTAKCGNGTCDTATESSNNCLQDCQEQPPTPQDQCRSNTQCDDNNPCTIDACNGTPKACIHTQITTCSSGDSCCPSGCTHSTDSDCPTADQCQVNSDCDDNDYSTEDTCSGTPKTCYLTLKTCSQRGGQICSSQQTCSTTYISSLDSNKCCPISCTTTAPCAGVSCSSDKKCVNGSCVLKTCSERGGHVCSTGQTCSGSTVVTSDLNVCCIGNCISSNSCADVNCSINKKCVNGSCVLKSCSEMGGGVCTGNELCDGTRYQTEDSEQCCVGTCREPGIKCIMEPNSPGETLGIVIIDCNVPQISISGQHMGYIIVKNNTGATIYNSQCIGSQAFAADVFGCPERIEKDAEITLHPIARGPATYAPVVYTGGYIELQYTNYFGVKKTEKIVVSAVPAIFVVS